MDRCRPRPRRLCRGSDADPRSAARVADGPLVEPGGTSGGVRHRGGRDSPEFLPVPAAHGNRESLRHARAPAGRDGRCGVCGRARPSTAVVIGNARSAAPRLRAVGARAPAAPGAGASRVIPPVEANDGLVSGTVPHPSDVAETAGPAACLSPRSITEVMASPGRARSRARERFAGRAHRDEAIRVRSPRGLATGISSGTPGESGKAGADCAVGTSTCQLAAAGAGARVGRAVEQADRACRGAGRGDDPNPVRQNR
jgi:hypothetical protein